MNAFVDVVPTIHTLYESRSVAIYVLLQKLADFYMWYHSIRATLHSLSPRPVAVHVTEHANPAPASGFVIKIVAVEQSSGNLLTVWEGEDNTACGDTLRAEVSNWSCTCIIYARPHIKSTVRKPKDDMIVVCAIFRARTYPIPLLSTTVDVCIFVISSETDGMSYI